MTERPVQRTHILHIAPAGQPVRGVSPYVDSLVEALKGIAVLENDVLDYKSMYPRAIHPARVSGVGPGKLHWAQPWTWWVKERPDVVHVQHWTVAMAPMLIGIVQMLRMRSVPVVLTIHNPVAHENNPSFGLDRFLWKLCDRVIVHGPRGRAVLERAGVDPHRIEVIPHGIMTGRTPSFSRRTDEVILFGNLRGYKGVDVLLDAWPSVAERLPGVRLRVVGRIWDRRLLDHQSLNRSDIRLDAQFVGDQDLVEIVSQATLAVFPYERFSSQSGACCFAIGNGTPVLVTDVGELPMIAGEDAAVVRPGDSKELADRIIGLMSDPAARTGLAERQARNADRMSWPVIAKMHSQVYGCVALNG